MAANRGKRLGTAVGFLGGLLLCLDALRDARVMWPPDALWSSLEHQHRLELGGGIAVILVSLALSVWRPAG
jgi:hypothetical protein